MGRRGPRQIVFVCSSVVNGKLVCETVDRTESEEAQTQFLTKFGVKPEIVLGPFYKKRMGVLNSQAEVQFSGKSKKAVFNDWYCTAMTLLKPENCVWLFFDTRVDGKKMPKPETLILGIDEVHFSTDEEIAARNMV